MTDTPSIMQDWLNTLARKQGTQFKLDAQGQCMIIDKYERFIILHGPVGSDHFYINIDLMDLPAEGGDLLFRTALTLNYFQSNTLGAAIAVDENASKLLLSFSRRYEGIGFNEFSSFLDHLSALSDSLRPQLLGAIEQQYDQQASVDQEANTFGLRI